MTPNATAYRVPVGLMWCSDNMTSARSALVKNSLPVVTYIYDTKCLQYFISTGMSRYMYVPGSLRPLASTEYISYLNLIVILCRKYHYVCAGCSMDLYMSSLMVQFWFF